MNQAELLDQFVIEARECLETIGKRLLEVERSPGDAALLNDLFRSVHTLKGNCGLFEFKPLETVVHAGEDLLDRVRNGSLAYSADLADALLAAMDFSAEMVDHIERHGCIDPAAQQRAAPLAQALRALITAATPAAAAPTPSAPAHPAPTAAAPRPSAVERPEWLSRLPAALLAATPQGTALRYQPEPECFFKGEDPWRLASTAPGLLHVQVGTQQPWPEGEALDGWDCFRCTLDIVLLSSADHDTLAAHFRCVPEQVALLALPSLAAADADAAATAAASSTASTASEASAAAAAEPTAPSPAQQALQRRAAALWADQLAQLQRPGLQPGALLGVVASLRGLLRCLPEAGDALASLQALAQPLQREAVLAWAHAQRGALPAPAGNSATPGSSAATAEPSGAVQPAAPVASAANAAGGSGNAATPDDSTTPGDRPQRVLKVGQEKIDRLMDLIGEMVVAKNGLPYLAQRAEDVYGQRELAREIKTQVAVINRIAEDMQHAIMQVRMLPVGTVFQRFGRLVRDISKKLGKEVHLVVEGEETEADKNVVEALADPLIHLVRNSLDHGIGTPQQRIAQGKPAAGTIRISARQEGDRVLIEISDDGAGVDPQRVRAKAVERGLIPADRAATLSDEDAVQLVFLPGFSTAAEITDLSGRGVGMDVVRTAVERLNGTVQLSSRTGQGTTVRLSLPLSMAVSHVMVIESAGRRFGVPMDLINETVRVHAEDIHHFKQSRTTVLRGRVVPLLALNTLLGIDAEPLRNAEGEHAVLVLRLGSGSNATVGLLVDQFHGASDIILKPLEGVLAGLTAFAGTALMGDGSVLMVLNPKELV